MTTDRQMLVPHAVLLFIYTIIYYLFILFIDLTWIHVFI